MILIPAIDLYQGSCVRLKQGQFEQMTRFNMSPIDRAIYFKQIGAQRLHVVDLDGAKSGEMQQLSLIQSMHETGITVQAGGGIRTLEAARACQASGIELLVLGSIAVTDPSLTQQIIKEIGAERIILAIDVRLDQSIPKPAIHGWQTSSESTLWELVEFYQQLGISQILCTDIACDGMLQGPNFDLYKEAVERFPQMYWQASGGIRNRQDIAKLDSLGVSAAILGLTLYQGDFNLPECLQEYA